MFPLKYLRENAEKIKEGIRRKGEDVDIDKILELDEKRREIIPELEGLQHKRKEKNKEIGRVKKEGGDIQPIIEEVRELSERIEKLEQERKKIEGEIERLLMWVPNTPHSSVPDEPVVVKEWGEPEEKELDHLTIAAMHNLLDFERGAKVAGSHFPLYVGPGARLERALVNFMLDLHAERHGYTEVFPPFLVREECMFGTGQLPKLRDDMYLIEVDNLFLNPTAEVPVTNMHREEVIDARKLPIKYVAYTACFRREAGSYGKETRGLQRVHQFNKVELVKITHPDTSYDELETLLQDAEEVLQLLGLPYRVVLLPAHDLSFASAKTYDIEVWAPGSKKYLEVSSASNFEAFQARRMRMKYNDGKKTDYVHTLNASGIATPRTMIALLEHYEHDGVIEIPEVLRKYMGGIERIE